MSPEIFSLAGKRVWVAGHKGMVGSAIVRRLASENCEVMTVSRDALDLRRQSDVERWMGDARPEVVVVAAAKVGGIVANNVLRAEFIHDNLAIASNIIHSAWQNNVEKLLFLGSTCIYPRLAPQPMNEDALLTGPLEPTNEPYAIAKIAGIKMCEAYRAQYGADFVSVMPTNLYGPGDNYHPEHSHVVAALIRRFHEAKASGAKEVTVWGTGTPRREFLYVDDAADACVFVLQRYSDSRILNVGVGTDLTIRELAGQIGAIVGYEGQVTFDTSRPDGTPRKLVDVTRINALGWRAATTIVEGLALAYRDFLSGQRAER